MNLPMANMHKQLMTVALSCVLTCVAFAPTTAVEAATKSQISAQKKIDRSGRATKGKSSYVSALKERYRRTPKAKVAARLDTGSSTGSKLLSVGKHPQGFGQSFIWDRKDKQVLLVTFINPQDHLGVSIQGLKAGDKIRVTSAAGIASFSKDEGNPFVSGLIGVVAAGAGVAATAAGYPGALPLIDAAESFAKDQFKATNAKHKRRDPWGIDPSTGHKARQEGGILVSMPAANGPYYSGNGSHRERWIKKPGVRLDKNRPRHVRNAFFPRRGKASHNRRTVKNAGELYITPWDHKFEDNAGYYKVYVRLTRGSAPKAPRVTKQSKPTPAVIRGMKGRNSG